MTHGAGRDARTRGRGCAGAVLQAGALGLAVLSFGGTVEMETFPGLHQNRAPVVALLCAVAALLLVAGAAVGGRRARAGLVVAVCVGGLLVWRLSGLAPMLHCWSYDSVAREDDGSYRCVDRGDMLPDGPAG